MGQMRLTNRRMKEIRSLAQKKYRERLGEMLVEGVRSVKSAVSAGAPIKEILVTEETLRQVHLSDASTVVIVSARELESISDVETSQGILAVVGIEQARPETLPTMRRVLALDGIQDPGNAGTILRTAAWFGVDAVVTAPGTVDLYNPKVVRAAMGGLWDVAHAPVENLAQTLSTLREHGFAVYAANLHGTDASEWQPRAPSIMVLGSEAHGISSAVCELIDQRVVIPGSARREGAESLNVGVAAGIMLYEWAKARKSG